MARVSRRMALGYLEGLGRSNGRSIMNLQTLDDVLMAELTDLLSAEKQLVEALPKVAESASSPELREAVEEHLGETRGHVQRLEKVFQSLGADVQTAHCKT